MARKNKVLFIGIDAAEQSLLLEWSRQGRLPTFRSLLESGAWGLTRNPPGLYVGAVWPSFHTAQSPTRHLRYCYTQFRPKTYDDYRVKPEQVQATPFWEEFGRQGMRVAVIDVPKARLASELNGIQIADWGTHDPEYKSVRTYPEPLAAEIVAKFGVDPVGICNGDRTSTEDYRTLRDALLQRIETKTELLLEMLRREDWDCFLAVLADSHCVGHQCWHLHDPAHPRYSQAIGAALGDPLQDVYQALDAALGRILDVAGDDTTKIVLASHGIGPHYEATFMLETILRRIESSGAAKVEGRPGRTPFLARVWDVLPKGVQTLLRPISRRTRNRIYPDTQRRSNSRCFKVPNNDVFGGIRINLHGREPEGKVSAEEFPAYCEFLRESLMAFENVDTGEPLVKKVWSIQEMYPGENTDALPDLLVEWNRAFPISRIASPRTGMIEATYRGCRTGDHREQGLFVMTGPGVAVRGQIGPVSVMDFGPTFADLLGVSLPGADGKSMLPALPGT